MNGYLGNAMRQVDNKFNDNDRRYAKVDRVLQELPGETTKTQQAR